MKINKQSEVKTTTAKIYDLIQTIIEKSYDVEYIYRGEPEYYDKVSSSLYREYHEIDAKYFDIEIVQREILEAAKQYIHEGDEWEVLTQLQHYGGKTNLIDFTSDCYIALFFACDGQIDENGRVIFKKKGSVKDQIREPRKPAERVIVQKSVFVRSPQGFIEPDDVIKIPAKLKGPILKYLQKYHNITTHTIYNDIHGFIKTQITHKSAYTEFYRGLTYDEKEKYRKSH